MGASYTTLELDASDTFSAADGAVEASGNDLYMLTGYRADVTPSSATTTTFEKSK